MTAQGGEFSAPANEAATITPSDTVDIATGPTRGVYVGVAGDVTAVMAGGSQATVLFKNVPTGVILPISVKRINATGTTATTMLALF